jgi:hypothetical protein
MLRGRGAVAALLAVEEAAQFAGDVAESGGGCGDDVYESVRALLGGDDLRVVAGRAALISAFPELADDLVAAVMPPEGGLG